MKMFPMFGSFLTQDFKKYKVTLASAYPGEFQMPPLNHTEINLLQQDCYIIYCVGSYNLAKEPNILDGIQIKLVMNKHH